MRCPWAFRALLVLGVASRCVGGPRFFEISFVRPFGDFSISCRKVCAWFRIAPGACRPLRCDFLLPFAVSVFGSACGCVLVLGFRFGLALCLRQRLRQSVCCG
mmetsp:Transcript_91121/g.294372  ORF Transcript_91121/g.294372 Transcript_91121/m.294372 type:complete len:103 (-) Transcript_91121:162-470(-)